jgi:hypothetical protein
VAAVAVVVAVVVLAVALAYYHGGCLFNLMKIFSLFRYRASCEVIHSL